MAKSQKEVGALACDVQVQFYLKSYLTAFCLCHFFAEVTFFLIHIVFYFSFISSKTWNSAEKLASISPFLNL